MIASPLLLKWVRVWGKLGASLAHPPLSTSPLHNTALQSLTKLLVKLPEYCCAGPQCLEESAIDLSRQGLSNDGSRRETTYLESNIYWDQ